MKYYKTTFLYPYINKTGKIPIGHPRILPRTLKTLKSTKGASTSQIVACCSLPAKINGKLLFRLCRTCMEEQGNDFNHGNRQSMLTGTWVRDGGDESIRERLHPRSDLRSQALQMCVSVRLFHDERCIYRICQYIF